MYQASQKQVDEWKAKYGDIFRIKVGDCSCYLHKPSRKQISYASIAFKSDPLKANELLLNDCWIDGDEQCKTDDFTFLSVGAKLAEVMKIEEAELEKL